MAMDTACTLSVTGSMLAPGRTKMKMVSSNRSVAKGHLANGTSTHGATAPVSSGYGTRIEYLWLKIAAIGASGALFGYAAKITNVYLPQVIRSQMVFKDFTMLKVFLAATLSGTVWFLLLSKLSRTKDLFNRIRRNFGTCIESKQIMAFIGGGAILGMGMTICGGCPGMVFIQVGSGNRGALYTLLGCFAGALLYGLLEPTLRQSFNKPHSNDTKHSIWIDEMVGTSYWGLALPFTLALIGGLVVAELYALDELTLPAKSHPVIGGLMMGSLQLLVGFAVEDSLGGSSSYCTILSKLGLSSLIPYFESYRAGLTNWWQVIYWMGAVISATLTSHLTGTWGRGNPISPVLGLLGGLMMVFGARMASGCTSGHGLSGMALMSYSSFVAVAAMFAGGIGLENSIRLLHN